VSAFGGEIKGSAPVGSAKGEVEVEIDHVDVARIEPLGQALGIPLRGTATAKLVLEAPDGKFNKANGTVDLTLADVVVSDGKTKIQGLIELPPAKLGDLVIAAEAKDGALKVTKLSANGTDLDIVGDGKITLREPWDEAVADLFLRFKFTDAYRGKNDTTKVLLGEPGATMPGLIEMQVPKMKRAKRPDGFYGWHIWGALRRLKFDPSTADFVGAPAGATPAKRPPLAKTPAEAPLKRPVPGAPRDDGPAPAPEVHRPAAAPPPSAPAENPLPQVPPVRVPAAPLLVPPVPAPVAPTSTSEAPPPEPAP
jgi:type II secretion system protein N